MEKSTSEPIDFTQLELKDGGKLPPSDMETEASLLNFLEKQQGRNQSIQSFIDYIPDSLFYKEEHQIRYKAILENHRQERRKDIPQQQAYWLSDLIDLKKKRELLNLVKECQTKIFANKQSYKIIKSRLIAQTEAI